MKLMVSSYNTGVSWNKEEEETKIVVPEDIALKAKSAIDRMLALK